ncbi:MAG: hypothetical protein C4333_10765 [Meiothermus sp.]
MDVTDRHVEVHHFEAFSSLGRAEGCQLHLSPELCWVYTGTAELNHVFAARLSPERLDPVVLETVQRFAFWHAPLTWVVGPSTQPPDLGQHLERFGFRLRESRLGMTLEPGALQPAPWVEGLALEPVPPAGLKAWAKVVALANAIPRTRLALLEEVVALTLEQPAWRHLLARLDGEPVAALGLLEAAGVVGLHWLATVPKARRRGIASALVGRALEAHAPPTLPAVLLATPQATGIARRLGFSAAGRYDFYTLHPK